MEIWYNLLMSSLLDQIISGDNRAVVEFYRLYSPKIFAFLSKRLPTLEDAQELTNDVFLEAIDSLYLLRNKNAILSWLYAIAHNKTVDFYRKRKIKSILLSKMPFLEIIESEVNQPEFQYEKNKVRDRIEKALHLLSYRYQKVLRLHYEEQIRIKDIAPILNLSFKATESLLFRARQSFKLAYVRSTSSGHTEEFEV